MNLQSLAEAILAELAREPKGIALARLSKRLDVRMSTLLRCIAYLGDDIIDGEPGPGLVRVVQIGERTMLVSTATDQTRCSAGAST